MKNKKYFLVPLINVFLIYLALFIFNSIDYFNRDKIIRKQISLDIINKIDAAKKGFLPVFYPQALRYKVEKIRFFPIGSLPNTNSYFCDEGYGLITYKSDRFGLRNNDEKWNNIYNNNNIFLIGDSFTHGACISEKDTLAANIESFSYLNTINLGQSGNGPYEYMALMKLFIKPIIKNQNNNNFVILNFYINDDLQPNLEDENLLKNLNPIIDFNQKKNIVPNKSYINNLIKIISENYPISKEGVIKKLENKNTKYFLRRNWYQKFSLTKTRKRIHDLFSLRINSHSKSYSPNSPSEKAIKLLSEVCISPCKPIIVYIPPSSFWFDYKLSNGYKKLLEESAFKNGVKFINGLTVINPNDQKNYAPSGPHLSKEGYKKLSRLISKEINKK